MTEADIEAFKQEIRELKPPGQPRTETEHLYLLVPEGLEHDAELCEQAVRLGCNAIVSPEQGRSSLHVEAAEAGLDVSKPVLFRRPAPPPPGPAPGDLTLRVAALEAQIAKLTGGSAAPDDQISLPGRSR